MKKNAVVQFGLVFFCVLLLTACGQKGISVDSVTRIADEAKIKQSPMFFADKLPSKDQVLLNQEEQQKQYEKFKKNFTNIWKQTKPFKGNLAYFRSYVQVPYEKRGYAENLQRWSEKNYQALARNAQYETFPSMARNGLVVSDAKLRLAPTDKPYFINPKRSGQAYPFDMFQNSTLRVGAAVKVFHVSYDNAWYYVEAASASGWVHREHIAFTTPEIEDIWVKASGYVAVTKDNVLVKNENFREAVNLGSVFPLISESVQGYVLAVPLQGLYGEAYLEHCFIEKKNAAKMPLFLTADKVAALSEQLMGNVYGWGGMYNDRDCSSTLQDLFTPFGIWLPRNSSQQAKAGQRIMLTDLSEKDKEDRIRSQAVPFQTLLYLPGHIGLYIGQFNGQAVMLHNMWGIRIHETERFIVGKTVITTLYPGKELRGYSSSLMSRVQSLTIVGRENEL